MRKDNTQNYQTSNSRIQHFNDLTSNINDETEELKKLRRQSQKNEPGSSDLVNTRYMKFNRVKYMLKKYNDFLFESIITESIVVYSDKFRSLLNKIESPVAKILLDIESKDINVANNYIDLDVNDKEKISFIADKRAQQILSPENREKYCSYHYNHGPSIHSESNPNIIFDKLECSGDENYRPSPNEIGEVITQAKSEMNNNIYCKVKFAGGIGIFNKINLVFKEVSNLPFIQNRQTIRIGRGIRGLLSAANHGFTDSEIEQFVNKYKSEFDKMNDAFKNFEMVSGEEIAYWYKYTNYEQQDKKGTLGSSCMRNVSSDFFDIYALNPEVCSLLILKTDDGQKIKGRALVWKCEKPIGMTFMDRIYTHEDSDLELFRQYGRSKGIFVKWHNNNCSDSSVFSIEDGEKINKGYLWVKIKALSYDSYPYLDTLKYYYYEDGNLSSKEFDYSHYTLEETDGGYNNGECSDCDGRGRVDCSQCGGTGEYDCSECYGNREIDCPDCNATGEIDCDECGGSGDNEECSDCLGTGKIDCGDCDGSGQKKCPDCDGYGTNTCSECGGDGYQNCPECGY